MSLKIHKLQRMAYNDIKIISTVPRLARKPHCDSGRIPLTIVRTNLFKKRIIFLHVYIHVYIHTVFEIPLTQSTLTSKILLGQLKLFFLSPSGRTKIAMKRVFSNIE